jgi:hypothetical protein
MLRLATRNLFTAFKNHDSKLISIGEKIFTYPQIGCQRFFSTLYNANQKEFKENFITSIKQKLKQGHSNIEDEELRNEIRSLYNKVSEEIQKNPEDQGTTAKIFHDQMKNIVKDHNLITISIGKNFSDKTIATLGEQLEADGYATAVQWASIYSNWVRSDIVLSFCKNIPGITDSAEMIRTELPFEESTRIFSLK